MTVKRIIRVGLFALYCFGGLALSRYVGNSEASFAIGWIGGVLACAAIDIIDMTRIR